MRILVTGGLGFIGSSLVRRLRILEHQVSFCDLGHIPDPLYMRCDISSFRQVDRMFETFSKFQDSHSAFDFVYHLAAEFGRQNGEEYYDTLWKTNVIGTKNLIRMQEHYGFKMIFASSSEVYGDVFDFHKRIFDIDVRQSEQVIDQHPIKQLNDYAISKWVNELQIINSAKEFKTKTVRVRFFNVYGPGEYYNSYRSAISRFIYCALTNQNIYVHKNQIRQSLFINDCIDTLINILDNFKIGEVYNLAGLESHSMEEVYEIITKILAEEKEEIELNFSIINKSDLTSVNRKFPDCGKAKQDLKHDPKICLHEGIKRTIGWMRKEYDL